MKRINDGNETAREIYKESVGEDADINAKGVQMYERPYLWRDDTPTTARDTFTENFIPTPTLNTNDEPKWSRILAITAIATAIVVITVAFFVGVMGGS